MDKFNSVVDAIKNVAILIAAILAIAYWYSYEFEVLFKEKVLNQSYWFYAGIWTNENEYIDEQYQIHKSDHDPSNGYLTNGNIVRSEAKTIVGRTEAGTKAGKARYVGKTDDCLHVLESVDFPIQVRENNSKPVKDACSNNRCAAIWVRAVPKMCG